MLNGKKVVCYFSASSGDWGGASRVLFTNLRFLDRGQFVPIVLIPNKGSVIPLLDELGIQYIIWGVFHEPGNWYQYLKDIFKCIHFFKQYKVDIFHINNCNYWRPAEMIASRILRIPVITHYHVVIEKPEPAPFVKMSRLLIANSNYTAAMSETDNVPIDVVYPVVDLKRFENASDVRKELNIAGDKIVISFIGQIRAIKGVDLFIKLAKEINRSDCVFLIVGSCRDPDKMGDTYTEQSLKEEIGSNKYIKYVGYHSDVENLYKSSDIIIMPSRWDEPFGLINIEAGAASRPIIATKVGGIPEVINHGDNGYLVEREDLEAMVFYTKKLVEDESLRRTMGLSARLIVEEKFTLEPIKKLEKIYNSL